MGKRSMKSGGESTPSSKKIKHNESVDAAEIEQEETYEQQIRNKNEISVPLASEKRSTKLYKLIRKASENKQNLTTGLKNVQRALRTNKSGVMVLAADIHPVDIYAHIPVLCERQKIPYIFAPSRKNIGKAMGFKRSVMITLIHQDDSYSDIFNECQSFMKEAHQKEVLPLK